MGARPIDGVIPPGAHAPAFTLPGLDGRAVPVPGSGARGSTLAVFFKNTCPTCRLTFPFLQRLHEQVAGSGARVIGISQDGREGAAEFAKELGLTLPILIDADGYPVSNQYGLLAVPTLYLFDSSGIIRRSGAGFSKAGLRQMADELAGSVGGKPPAIFTAGEELPDFKPG